jgi:hypothetical protein
VLVSSTTVPGSRPATKPSGPLATDRRAPSSNIETTIMRALVAACRGVSQKRSPCMMSDSARAAVRL